MVFFCCPRADYQSSHKGAAKPLGSAFRRHTGQALLQSGLKSTRLAQIHQLDAGGSLHRLTLLHTGTLATLSESLLQNRFAAPLPRFHEERILPSLRCCRLLAFSRHPRRIDSKGEFSFLSSRLLRKNLLFQEIFCRENKESKLATFLHCHQKRMKILRCERNNWTFPSGTLPTCDEGSILGGRDLCGAVATRFSAQTQGARIVGCILGINIHHRLAHLNPSTLQKLTAAPKCSTGERHGRKIK